MRCWQAYGATTDRRTGWRNDAQGRQNSTSARVWKRLPDRIMIVADRLRDAQVENRPALEVIERHHHPSVLIYADPPCLLRTRSGRRLYKHEMTEQEHAELLEVLDRHPGPVVLSGYSNPLYDDRLSGWGRKTSRAAAERGRIRQEVLWLNPVAVVQLGAEQLTLDA